MAEKRHKRGAYHVWTVEQEHFLIDSIVTCKSYANLQELFNNKFATSATVRMVEHRCRKLGLKRPYNAGQFQNGGATPPNTKPIGTEEITCGNEVIVKVSTERMAWRPKQRNNTGKNNRKCWRLKKHVEYERAHGKIPVKHDVIFLDGNKRNFSPDNLYAISHQAKMRLLINGWVFSDKNATLAAVKLCELNIAIKKSTK